MFKTKPWKGTFFLRKLVASRIMGSRIWKEAGSACLGLGDFGFRADYRALHSFDTVLGCCTLQRSIASNPMQQVLVLIQAAKRDFAFRSLGVSGLELCLQCGVSAFALRAFGASCWNKTCCRTAVTPLIRYPSRHCAWAITCRRHLAIQRIRPRWRVSCTATRCRSLNPKP